MSINVEVSTGEFLDKLSILQIKLERVTDPKKSNNIHNELCTLSKIWKNSSFSKAEISREIEELRDINQKLWNLEDDIRKKEAEKSFDDEFIQMARSVYVTNDQRADIKRRINQKLGSKLIEEKSYTDYISG